LAEDGIIKVIKYKYKIGDLVEFRLYNGNTRSHEVIVGVVLKRNIQHHFWYKEAEKQVFQSGRNFLIYDIAHESGIYTVKEKEILKLVSTKLN